MKPVCKVAYSLVLMISTISCDPGLDGGLKICNQTDSVITVVAFDDPGTGMDSVVYTVGPRNSAAVKVFNRTGSQASFDCCPCEIDSLCIRTVSGVITKSPADESNWIIPNKSVQKAFGGEDLRCEFHVLPSDL